MGPCALSIYAGSPRLVNVGAGCPPGLDGEVDMTTQTDNRPTAEAHEGWYREFDEVAAFNGLITLFYSDGKGRQVPWLHRIRNRRVEREEGVHGNRA